MLSIDESGQQHSFFPFYLKIGKLFFPWSFGFEGSTKIKYLVFHRQYNIQKFLDRNIFKDLKTTKNWFFYCVNHCRFNNINSQSNDLLTSFIMACFRIVIVISALLYFYRLFDISRLNILNMKDCNKTWGIISNLRILHFLGLPWTMFI